MVKTAYFKTDDHLIAIAEDILSSGRSRKMRGPFMDEFEKFSNIYGSELYNLFSKYPDKFQITGSNFNDAKIKLIKKSYFVLPPVVEKVLNNIHTAPDEFVTHESPIFSGIPPEQVMASLLYLFLKKEIFMVGDSSLPENERIRFVYSTKEDRMREYAFLLGKKTIIYKYPDEGYAKNLYNWTNEITVRRNINAFLYFMPYQEGCILSQTPIAPQNTPISSPTPNNSRPQNTPTSNNQQSFTVQNVPFEVLIGFSQTIVDEAGGLSQVLLGECMNIYFGFNSTMYNDLIKKLLDTPYFELRSGFIFSTKPYPLPPYYLNIYNQIFDFPTKSYKIGGNDFPNPQNAKYALLFLFLTKRLLLNVEAGKPLTYVIATKDPGLVIKNNGSGTYHRFVSDIVYYDYTTDKGQYKYSPVSEQAVKNFMQSLS